VKVKLMLPIAFYIPPVPLVWLAVLAEECGLDGITCGELNGVEAYTVLAAIAVRTERIHLETAITAVPTRSTDQILAEAKGLARLAPGRFTLGLGAGTPFVAAFHGRPFAEPLAHTRAVLRELRSGLADEGVPVTLAAVNDGMLYLAAQEADGAVLSLLTPPDLVERSAQKIRAVRRGAGIEGQFEVTAIQYGYAGEDESTAARSFRREVAAKYDVSTYRRAALASATEAEVDAVATAWRARDRDLATSLVPESAVSALLTTGDATGFAARLTDLAARGADSVIFVPVTPTRATPSDAERLITALGEARRQLA
jgi:alkanesulfonate monooxygenase SsuD/methylene tetrahydromethanopterin reductase-like flavin-dependent oxidoreductase (luciferase family)